MKNLKFITALILSSVLLVACSAEVESEPDQTAEELIKEGIENMAKVKSASYELALDGTFENEDPLGDYENVDFDVSFSGQYDFNDLSDSQFSLLIELILSIDGSSDQNLDGEVTVIDNNLYFAVTDISDFDGDLPQEMVAPFLSQWWFIPIPEESLATLELYYEDGDAYLTEEEKQIKALFKDIFIFKDIEYQGSEKIGEINSYYYTSTLDEDAIKNYLLELAEITGETVPDSDIENLDNFLNSLDLSLDLWISQDDNTLIKIAADASVSEDPVMSVDFKGSYTLSDLNDAVNLEAPENASMFDPFALMMGASALAPAADSYDDSYYGELEDPFANEIIFEEFSDDDFSY